MTAEGSPETMVVAMAGKASEVRLELGALVPEFRGANREIYINPSCCRQRMRFCDEFLRWSRTVYQKSSFN